ncbi:MAG: FG-GAP-like repeat-containing protein, partial [Acidobacteriota bacterium]
MRFNARLFIFAFLLFVCLGGTLYISTAQTENKISPANRENAYRANNVGVAYLEQFDYAKAAESFRQALKIDPKLKLANVNLAIALFNQQDMDAALQAAKNAAEIAPEYPQTSYILGLIARNQNRAEDAVASFEKVLKIDPNDVGANVNLGQIYIQQRNYAEAETFFRKAVAAEPYNSTAIYNLATVLLRSDARDEGKHLMARFQDLRQSGAATSIGQNYLEQGRYAEAVASTGAESGLVDRTAPPVVFQNVDVNLPSADVNSKNNSAEIPAQAAALFDYDNNGDLDLVKIDGEPAQIHLYKNGKNKYLDVTKTAGDLSKPLNLRGYGVVAGDFDNDTFPDLLVFGKGQTTLFRNDGKGGFENVTAKAKIPASSIISISGAFLDADHDGDLDIFLGGYADDKHNSAANRLLRNNGDGTFTDISEQAKINVPSRAVAVVPTDYDNRRDIDLLVLNRGGKPNLFRNLRDGSFKDVAAEVGLNQSDDWISAAAGDFNKDTYTDFFFGRGDGRGVFAISDGRGQFTLKDAPEGTENAASAQFLDYDNDGLLDLIVNTDQGFAVARNLGDGWAKAVSSAFKIKPDAENALINSRQILSGDIDLDGDVDLLAFAKNGALKFIQNVGGDANNSESVRLKGRVSNRTGIGAKVDMRAGSLAQKLETYAASPMPAPSEVIFGLGKREKSDAVRVIWTSGVVQSEIKSAAEAKQTAKNFEVINIEELDRKPSSCPYLYTWNGEKFEFITDFLGGGEMGNWQGKGVYDSPDSDEFVRITSDQLKPQNGKYEIRVTNELEEVLFLDNLKLVAVEHDADSEVFPNGGLGIPTAGQKILYQTKNASAPLSAVDTNGKNILPKIVKLDRVFYDDFQSLNIRGYAENHSLTLNLDSKKGYKGRTLLLLMGWTDYAFSSDNVAASQSGKSQFLPYLQVKNKRGEWQTVIDSIGISIGRPQTLVVDLTGKFLTDSREIRIVTNFKTYWDKIAVDTSEQKPDLKTIELKPAQADLRERGYSAESKINEMIAPDYTKVSNDERWKYFAGKFTRTGDVKPLLNEIDDVFVISKTGDELVLS